MTDKLPHGRPTLYKVEYDDQAYKYCLLGATDATLATFFSVNEDTVHEWKKVHASFSESIKAGKEVADAKVADSLYNRAMGYTHDDVDLKMFQGEIISTPIKKHYPPDTTAAIFWLKNRQKANWRDKSEVEHSGEINRNMSDEELDAIIERGSRQTSTDNKA